MHFRPAAFAVASLFVLLFASASFGKASHIGWPRVDTSSQHFFKSYSRTGVTKVGTDKSDELLGFHGSDKLYGGGGKDVIWGDWKPNHPKTQSDYIDGGTGNDFLYASRGTNVMIGGEGNDFIKARTGRGAVDCGPGKDIVIQSHLRRKRWNIAKNCEKISYRLDRHQE